MGIEEMEEFRRLKNRRLDILGSDDDSLDEPLVKRWRSSIITEDLSSASFEKIFQENWSNNTPIKYDDLELITSPFKVCRIYNFIQNNDFLEALKSSVAQLPAKRLVNDLYTYQQTISLLDVDSDIIKQFVEVLSTKVKAWMSRTMDIELNDTISLSSACYNKLDYLLCHDDQTDDRRIAFILYVSPVTWDREDGGTLDLFDVDEHGLPRNIIHSIVPVYNSMVFFEVTNESYHQVSEILSDTKARWTISGWFHGPLTTENRPCRPLRAVTLLDPTDDETDESLRNWIAAGYFGNKIIKQIQIEFEEKSYTFLGYYIHRNIFEKLTEELSSESISWRRVGPADERNYEKAEESTLPLHLGNLFKMLKSAAFFRLLANYTGLALDPVTAYKPKMMIELQRWKAGCYTLISDNDDDNNDDGDDNREKNSGISGLAHDNSQPGPSSGVVVGGKAGKDDLPKEDTVKGKGKGGEVTDELYDLGAGTSKDLGDVSGWDTEKEMALRKNTDAYPVRSGIDQQISVDVGHYHPVLTNYEGNENCTPEERKRREKRRKMVEREIEFERQFKEIEDRMKQRAIERAEEVRRILGQTTKEDERRREEIRRQAELEDDEDDSEDGSKFCLEAILQFNTKGIKSDETIDYVDPGETQGVLAQVPQVDNYLCLVYRSLSVRRLQRYVNHSFNGCYYTLIATYYEDEEDKDMDEEIQRGLKRNAAEQEEKDDVKKRKRDEEKPKDSGENVQEKGEKTKESEVKEKGNGEKLKNRGKRAKKNEDKVEKSGKKAKKNEDKVEESEDKKNKNGKEQKKDGDEQIDNEDKKVIVE